jgi:hypothetical protein
MQITVNRMRLPPSGSTDDCRCMARDPSHGHCSVPCGGSLARLRDRRNPRLPRSPVRRYAAPGVFPFRTANRAKGRPVGRTAHSLRLFLAGSGSYAFLDVRRRRGVQDPETFWINVTSELAIDATQSAPRTRYLLRLPDAQINGRTVRMPIIDMQWVGVRGCLRTGYADQRLTVERLPMQGETEWPFAGLPDANSGSRAVDHRFA